MSAENNSFSIRTKFLAVLTAICASSIPLLAIAAIWTENEKFGMTAVVMVFAGVISFLAYAVSLGEED